jgi:hypothetical protein
LATADLKGHDFIVLNRERPVRHQLEAEFYEQSAAPAPASMPIPSPVPARLPPKSLASRWSATSSRANMRICLCS